MMLKTLTKLAKKLTSAVACALVLVIAASCSFFEKPVDPTTVTLSETAITIGVGDSKRVTAQVSDDSDVVWTTSNARLQQFLVQALSEVLRQVARL